MTKHHGKDDKNIRENAQMTKHHGKDDKTSDKMHRWQNIMAKMIKHQGIGMATHQPKKDKQKENKQGVGLYLLPWKRILILLECLNALDKTRF